MDVYRANVAYTRLSHGGFFSRGGKKRDSLWYYWRFTPQNRDTTMKYMHLMGMSKKELHNYLNGKVHYQPKLRKHYYDTVTAQQEARANAKRRDGQAARYWLPILKPLQAEVKRARAAIAHKTTTPTPERYEALTAYYNALHKLAARMTNAMGQGMTPHKLMDALKDKGRVVPNKGEHWVDWIPHKTRETIDKLFDGVPHRPNARSKKPFERPVSKQPDVDQATDD